MEQIVELVYVKDEDFFLFGKGEKGYYLKNRFTEMPNEFSGEKELKYLREEFERLCGYVAEAEPIEDIFEMQMIPDGNWGCAKPYVKVTFADRTTQWYRVENKDLLFWWTAIYSDFAENIYYWKEYEWAQFTALKVVRRICEQKILDYGFLIKALKNGWEDDYTWVDEVPEENGGVSLDYYCYAVCQWRVIIGKDGTIEDAGDLRVMQVLKAQGVKVQNIPDMKAQNVKK